MKIRPIDSHGLRLKKRCFRIALGFPLPKVDFQYVPSIFSMSIFSMYGNPMFSVDFVFSKRPKYKGGPKIENPLLRFLGFSTSNRCSDFLKLSFLSSKIDFLSENRKSTIEMRSNFRFEKSIYKM